MNQYERGRERAKLIQAQTKTTPIKFEPPKNPYNWPENMYGFLIPFCSACNMRFIYTKDLKWNAQLQPGLPCPSEQITDKVCNGRVRIRPEKLEARYPESAEQKEARKKNERDAQKKRERESKTN